MKCPNCGYAPSGKSRGRSNPQNSYLHGVILPILAFNTGYTNEEMKAVLKWKFKIKSTSALTTAEFEKFMSDVRMWASAELGAYIPAPNEDCVMTESCA